MVFDLGHEYFPKFFKFRDLWQLRLWTAWSAWNVNKIIAISNSAKNDMAKLYHVNPKKIVVSYPGCDDVSSYKPIKDQQKTVNDGR